MKKHLPLFLISVLLLFFISVACNSNNESSSNENSLVEETAVASRAEDISEAESADIGERSDEETVIPTNAPPPTATATPDNPAPEPVKATFSLQDANPEIPDDVMQEIAYHVAGGGGDDDICLFKEDGLSWFSISPLGLYSSYLESPPVVTKMGTIEVETCGWEQNEQVSVTLKYPDGLEVIETYTYPPEISRINISTNGARYFLREVTESEINYIFQPMPDDALGTYTLFFQGDSLNFELQFEVIEPDRPVARLMPNAEWLLYNFAPGELVRLIAMSEGCPSEESHGNSTYFCGWDEYDIGNDGSLIIETPDIFENPYIVEFIGDMSGAAYPSHNLTKFIGASELVLKVSDSSDDSYNLIMPGTRFEVLFTSDNGQLISFIRFSDGVTGWVNGNSVIRTIEVETDDYASSIVENSTKLPEFLSQAAPIPGDSYKIGADQYGSPYSEDAEKPSHFVDLDDYWIQRTEVSNSDYAECVNSGVCTEPSQTSSATRDNYYNNPEYEDYPVIFVSYYQAEEYCNWWGGRLPTEAEWESAARLTPDAYYPNYTWIRNPEDIPDLELLLNFDDLVGDTVPVNSYLNAMTPLGLLHVHGNVWEWTQDWYNETYYVNSPEDNPLGPESGTEKVLRGGSWSTGVEFISLTNRFKRDPNQGYDNVGFRCVTTIEPEND